MKKVVWINGWGLGSSYIEVLAAQLYPNVEHIVVMPKDSWEMELKQQPSSATVVAYSLGAFLLLGRPDLVNRFDRVVFAAPFEDFKKESGRGGRVQLAQLRYLRRWLEKDQDAAILDFMERADLTRESNKLGELSKADCIWGVDRLINDSVEPGSLEAREAYIGEADRLLDTRVLSTHYPNMSVLPGVGHDLGELLKGSLLKL